VFSFSKEITNAKLRVLSLGAGVQSTVMALMADNGELSPKPNCAIFADTHSEPQEVYNHLNWLKNKLTFPIYKVSHGNLKDDALKGKNKYNTEFSTIPFYTTNGIGRRQCTRDYKIDPIREKIRQLLNLKKGQRVPKDVIVEQWVGISFDEIQRIKDSRDKWTYNRYPLIEKNLRRHDCISWFNKNYPSKHLPRSACTFCPYKTNAEWRYLRDNDPQAWLETIEFDESIRNVGLTKIDQFVHKSKVPLKDADLSTAEDKGQLNFLDECDGMCGV
tara:strand:+ start:6533 stop:7354 length:822 start_codon:yes stop_codon:yes gene_type:complete